MSSRFGAEGSQRSSESGAITAEFAVLMPAALLILGAGLALFKLGLQEITLSELASQAARQFARGESQESVLQTIQLRLPSATMRESTVLAAGPDVASLSCIEVIVPSLFEQSSKSCAPSFGR